NEDRMGRLCSGSRPYWGRSLEPGCALRLGFIMDDRCRDDFGRHSSRHGRVDRLFSKRPPTQNLDGTCFSFPEWWLSSVSQLCCTGIRECESACTLILGGSSK